MYLDKPLRPHTLFQAICRTNRRWTNPATGQEKLYGLVVDYIGLGNQIAGALRDADPDRGGRRPVDVDGLAEEFMAAIEATVERFSGIDRTDTSFAALMAHRNVSLQERIATPSRPTFFESRMWESSTPPLQLLLAVATTDGSPRSTSRCSLRGPATLYSGSALARRRST